MDYFNFLGTYESISALWADYPEGGHEGDYAIVGTTYYGWNKYSRIWIETTAPTGTSEEEIEEGQSEPTLSTSQEEEQEPEGQIAVNVNFRGEYESISEAWQSMPNGGQEGDFITIDDTQYSWNKYTRQWVISDTDDVAPITPANTMLAAANSIDINYLGTFASVSDVWAFYPEGGNEGEYVVIDDSIYSWSNTQHQWTESDNETITIAQLEQSPSTNRINYLGAYATLGDIWAAHPEGGYEGDYIHLGEEGEEEIQVWNKWERNWGDNGDPQTPAIIGQTFDGTLTINYDLYVQGAIHGTVGNATKWNNHSFADYINQALRTTDNVQFSKVTAGQFVKSGGTASQFLKADGSIDSNTYLTEHQSLDSYATSMAIIQDTSIVLKHGNTTLSTLTKSALRDLIGTGGGGGSITPEERAILSLFEYSAENHTLNIKKVNNVAIDFWNYGEVTSGGIGSGTPGESQFLYQLTDVYHSGVNVLRADGTARQDGDALVYSDTSSKWVASAISSSYTLPIASASTLGGIKVGSGLAIDANGVLSATGGGGGGGPYLPLAGGTLTGYVGYGVTPTHVMHLQNRPENPSAEAPLYVDAGNGELVAEFTRGTADSEAWRAFLKLTAYLGKGLFLSGGGSGCAIGYHNGTSDVYALNIDTSGNITANNKLFVSGTINSTKFLTNTSNSVSYGLMAGNVASSSWNAQDLCLYSWGHNVYVLASALRLIQGYGIEDESGSGLLVFKPTDWSGITSSQWGVGSTTCQGVIRSDNNNLLHYKGGTLYTIYDSGNCNNLSTDWSCGNLSCMGGVTIHTSTYGAHEAVFCPNGVKRWLTGVWQNTNDFSWDISTDDGSDWLYGRMRLSPTGNLSVMGEISGGSDLRWKKNISEFGDYRAILRALRPCEWDWKEGHGNGHSCGFIAQEIADIMPYAVRGNNEDGYTLNYNTFHAVWASALQHHESKIEYLERRVKELELQLKTR